jgi:hypothetical protein
MEFHLVAHSRRKALNKSKAQHYKAINAVTELRVEVWYRAQILTKPVGIDNPNTTAVFKLEPEQPKEDYLP